ncbi:MAG: Rpn family recombination-promoting nuclease/putative transposase, partial [Janthinobacterium lividum]
RFRSEDAFFLIHVENQSTAQTDFPKRMFRYFARLTEKYDLPVYPVVVFSYDSPQRPEPTRFVVSFPGKTVLRFEYSVIQLNRLPWRRFVCQENPVASALMAKMKMSVRERPRVKAECLRLLASLKLDPARTKLIGGFVDSYLKLNAQEMKQFERAVDKFAPTERIATMEITTSWERMGIAQGLAQGISQGLTQGKETLVARLLRRRLGSVPSDLLTRLDPLTPDQLDDLGEALLDFTTTADLEQWLAQHQ